MTDKYDLLCFSHLRWDFVFQRPQHLLTRFSKARRVFYVEEPVFHDISTPQISCVKKADNLFVVTPQLPKDYSQESIIDAQRYLLGELLKIQHIHTFVSWYYTPMALKFSRHLTPIATIYDCMDELSLFKFAPPELTHLEAELLNMADVVFTGGQTLYEAKKSQHHNIYPFPSSIDQSHFGLGRDKQAEPEDQKHIPGPRLGFFGVIDERMDIDLLAKVAEARPQWNLVMIGPVVKIDPTHLPKHTNIHYLGGKSYQELPHYIAGWDVALLPFAINDSTKFISPTKTPEYLAAGKPVVSTPIRDVVYPYGEKNLVKIAKTAEEFIDAAESHLNNLKPGTAGQKKWLADVDEFLGGNSWDKTWERMAFRIAEAVELRLEKREVARFRPSKLWSPRVPAYNNNTGMNPVSAPL